MKERSKKKKKIVKPVNFKSFITAENLKSLIDLGLSEQQQSNLDLAPGEWDGSGSTSLDVCHQKAITAGVHLFAWTDQVYNGYCKVLKKDFLH